MSARRRKGRRTRQLGWDAVGLAVFAVMVFPVFWMISTAFKSDDQIVSLKPTWFPLHPTLAHFTEAINRPYFWQDVKNSLIVVSVTVAIAIVRMKLLPPCRPIFRTALLCQGSLRGNFR